jgi:flagellar hook-associated protein 1 FlgK
VTVGRINDMGLADSKTSTDRIMKSQAVGDRPNDLLDKRDALVQELSKLADITHRKARPR